MTAPRVLVMGCSAGHGHMMAARACADALRSRHPSIDVTEIDALRMVSRWFGRSYRLLYLKMADRAPIFWRALYDASDRKTSLIGHEVARFAGRPLLRACVRWKPHVVLATHFLAAEVLGRALRQGRLDASLQAVITDHDAHRMWYWPQVARYYVASDLVKARVCLRFGVPEDRVFVTGIPVREPFTREHDLREVRSRYGLDPRRPVVLFMSGGFAAGPIRQSILGIWRERRDVQILAVCGRNERLRRAIVRMPRPDGAALHALGFVRDPWELYAVSDLVVTKSGGVTTAEAAAMGKPMLLSTAIPGQEERNVEVLLEAGAAVRARTPEEIRWRVTRLLANPERLAEMGRAARAFGRPDAAARIADLVAEELEEPHVWGPHFHGARAPERLPR
jgi:processive 1,2-diacylglycerol beta-glucosyltransferase